MAKRAISLDGVPEFKPEPEPAVASGNTYVTPSDADGYFFYSANNWPQVFNTSGVAQAISTTWDNNAGPATNITPYLEEVWYEGAAPKSLKAWLAGR